MISLNGENVVGKKPTDLLDKLVGKKGEHVKMEMMRGKERMEFELVLDIIPIPTVEAAYMVDSTMGYLKLTCFSENAAKEFKRAMQKLQNQGMKDLILDLQGNLRGDLQAAADIIDQFLDGKKMITYLDGRSIRDTFWYTWRATPEGLFQKGRLVVLVNRKSASASELLSGTVQDWDRGLIVGRRTFGKGCAQRVFHLRDASLLNLTFAHFYTPSGRCLQKLYKGKEDYWGETNRRDSTGELVNADSIRVTDTVKYYTKLRHRIVYGGGGVIPDIFVPVDTAKYWDYLDSLSDKNVVYDYIVDYVDKQLDQLEKTYPTFADFRERFEVTDEMLGQLVAAGEEKGVKKVAEFHRLVSYLKSGIKANIAKFMWDENEYHQIINEETDSFKVAVKALRDGTYEQKMGEVREAETTFAPTSRKEGEAENEKKE